MVNSAVALLLASVICFISFSWLALAINIHWRQVMETELRTDTRRALQISGSLGLLISAVFCFIADHPSMAVLVWIMLLAVTAPAVGMLLAWRPMLLRWLWPLAR